MTVGPGVAEPGPSWGLGGDLPDLNVWLALVVQEHPHHALARRYWEDCAMARTLGQKQHFCRATMLGLVRLLCQPKLMGDGVLGLADAFAIYRQLRDTAGVAFCTDAESADSVLAEWTQGAANPLPARLWSDAWLAAVAESADLRLVSFDADFKRFGLTRCLILQS
ncbi:MAG: PIN domain-containing protein [Rhodoferax sp.]|nr:PIN domain-containing protein [Rhodoferax sp.]